MKKVIFIDWSKTLCTDLFWGHLINEQHENHKYFKIIDDWLYKKNRQLINPWMLGKITYQEIAQKISKDTNISAEVIINELRYSCESMRIFDKKVVDLVKKLRRNNMLIVIATDNMDTFNKFTVPALGLDKIFDEIINSFDVGCFKDDKEPQDKIMFFEKFIKKHNLKYSEAILLDDSPDISKKYKKLGFDRVIIGSPSELYKTLNEYI